MVHSVQLMKYLPIFLILISIVSIAGCTKKSHEDEEMHPTIFTLMIDNIEPRILPDSSTVWDVYISVDNILTTDKEYPWDTITVKVWDSEKEDQLQSGVYPDKFQYGADLGEDYHAWYEEFSGHPDNIDIADRIVITGMTEEYEAAFVSIYYQRNIAGSIQLDSDFI